MKKNLCFAEKECGVMELKEFFEKNPRAAIAFSGGADSAYLLYASKRYGAQVRAYYIKTAFQPRFEYDDAVRICADLGVSLKVIEYNILSECNIANNSSDRCYHCKKKMFTLLKNAAKEDGFDIVLDGTNASDKSSERAGMRAAAEEGVRSPLRECGLEKDKIRALSREAGLFTWDKPAYACLATRITQGERITSDMLRRVESAEAVLAEIGFLDFRVRVHGGAARIQLKENQLEMALKYRAEILERVKPYFDVVLLDMEAR